MSATMVLAADSSRNSDPDLWLKHSLERDAVMGNSGKTTVTSARLQRQFGNGSNLLNSTSEDDHHQTVINVTNEPIITELLIIPNVGVLDNKDEFLDLVDSEIEHEKIFEEANAHSTGHGNQSTDHGILSVNTGHQHAASSNFSLQLFDNGSQEHGLLTHSNILLGNGDHQSFATSVPVILSTHQGQAQSR